MPREGRQQPACPATQRHRAPLQSFLSPSAGQRQQQRPQQGRDSAGAAGSSAAAAAAAPGATAAAGAASAAASTAAAALAAAAVWQRLLAPRRAGPAPPAAAADYHDSAYGAGAGPYAGAGGGLGGSSSSGGGGSPGASLAFDDAAHAYGAYGNGHHAGNGAGYPGTTHAGAAAAASLASAVARGQAHAAGGAPKHLLQSHLYSVESLEPSLGSLEDYSGFDTLDSDGRADGSGGVGGGVLHGKQASVATFEVLRVDAGGQVRRVHVRRRDLLREHRLQPRDLRRVDPSVDVSKTSPSIAVKENVLLVNLGGVRAIITAEKALFFEPNGVTTRRLLDIVIPRLQASAGARLAARQRAAAAAAAAGGPGGGAGGAGGPGAGEADVYLREAARSAAKGDAAASKTPFELEVLEGVLMVTTGRLERHMTAMSQRVHALMTKLPNDINPINLEELRRIKQDLVQLENKADQLRELLEQIMDDEDELREINLSSRPRREERRKQRERDRANRQLSRAKEEMEERRRGEGDGGGSSSGGSSSSGRGDDGPSPGGGGGGAGPQWPVTGVDARGLGGGANGRATGSGPGAGSYFEAVTFQQQIYRGRFPRDSSGLGGAGGGGGAAGAQFALQRQHLAQAARRQRMAELYLKFGERFAIGGGPGERFSAAGELRSAMGGGGGGGMGAPQEGRGSGGGGSAGGREDGLPRSSSRARDDADFDPEDEYQDAQDALDELLDQEEEEAELEEVEDLLEYYLQRAGGTQSEAERQLEGARDLEESIGVSLSARRYEVNRLELMLSMGSFAAALGAMIAGIFGMNMKSTLEFSVAGFWGVTGAIVVGCAYVFVAIMRYTQRRKIL